MLKLEALLLIALIETKFDGKGRTCEDHCYKEKNPNSTGALLQFTIGLSQKHTGKLLFYEHCNMRLFKMATLKSGISITTLC